MPPIVTRNSKKQALERCFNEFLDAADADSPIRLAFAAANYKGIDRIAQADAQLRMIEYTDPADNTKKKLTDGDIAEIYDLKRFINHIMKKAGKTTLDTEDFDILTYNDFSMFQMQGGGTLTIPGQNSSGGTSSTSTEVDSFKKGIKRDIQAYDKIVCDTQYFKWFENFSATAHSQDLQDVVDSSYVPSTPAKIAVFELQNKFLFSVCNKSIRTPEGQKIVRKYKMTQDAQKVLSEYMSWVKTSPKVTQHRNDLLESLSSSDITVWRGPYTLFLSYFEANAQEYNDIVLLPTQKLNEDMLIIKLAKCVFNEPSLNNIWTQEERAKALGLPSLSYAAYTVTLHQEASRLDIQRGVVKKAPRRGQLALNKAMIRVAMHGHSTSTIPGNSPPDWLTEDFATVGENDSFQDDHQYLAFAAVSRLAQREPCRRAGSGDR